MHTIPLRTRMLFFRHPAPSRRDEAARAAAGGPVQVERTTHGLAINGVGYPHSAAHQRHGALLALSPPARGSDLEHAHELLVGDLSILVAVGEE